MGKGREVGKGREKSARERVERAEQERERGGRRGEERERLP